MCFYVSIGWCLGSGALQFYLYLTTSQWLPPYIQIKEQNKGHQKLHSRRNPPEVSL